MRLRMLLSRQASFRYRSWICHNCRASSSFQQQEATKERPSQRLPDFPARTRFAPSPTGYLHLGSLRTALYNYLLAKATGGQFILRIEDTDTKRTVPGAEEQLYHDLRWAGLNWDEGPQIGGSHGPYKQSERTVLYQEHAQTLLKSQNAYRCFCSPQRLKELAKRQTQYDGGCRHTSIDESEERAANGEAHVIRLKTPAKLPSFNDLVYGSIGNRRLAQFTSDKAAYEDIVLLKSDGLPTYHLANVVDDNCMRITHVIRALEWISSTPKHVLLYKAFGWVAPSFAHVGLLQDSQQQKLSKRNVNSAGLDVRGFQDQGILPEALLNYVALYGWSHKRTSDVLNLEQLIHTFDLKFTKGNTIVTPQKLIYFQKKYALERIEERAATFDSMVEDVFAVAQKYLELHPESIILSEVDLKDRISRTLEACKHNYYTTQEFYRQHFPYFQKLQPEDYFSIPDTTRNTRRNDGRMVTPEKSNDDYILRCGNQLSRSTVTELVESQLEHIEDRFQQLPPSDWSENNLRKTMDLILAESKSLSSSSDANLPTDSTTILYFIRWILAAGWSGPPIAQTMVLIGRETSLYRLANFPAIISAVKAPQVE
ncbi:MAG: hypothetical protein Q9195_008315 [Heterodermia aff. obscurata]